ncbi:unnamed protein product [Adineta ricciae]|uniref:Cytochrome P450 n=1 Tax=Adineta ricciae TaxID=249248 RepID=A0A815U106_ADIRI|nr:unnamed protein product [Adineta ricciae]CAF1513245.1 unnamed protein product [Adineta ricciae]
MSIISIILICILLCLVCYAVYQRFCYFKNRSIPCPPLPSIFLGHLPILWSVKSHAEQLRQWTQQYGSVYGLFEGIRPMYVTSDVAFIEEIFVKQFHRFPIRRLTLLNRSIGHKLSNVFSAGLLSIWRRQRRILTPTFTGAKMRRLLPTVDTCVNLFMDKLNTVPSGSIFNIYELYKRLTMDVICRCAFGIDTDVQNDMENQNIYMKKVAEMFAKNHELTLLPRMYRVTSHTVFGGICVLLFKLKRLITTNESKLQANVWLLEHMNEFVQQRFNKTETHKPTSDLLQLMMNAVHSDKDMLTPTELLSNVFVVLAAGFETTSTALAYCTYCLALHQDIQEKLYQELVEHWCPDETNTYDIISSKLTFMDLFVREVLRMYPPVPQVVHRQCTENTHVAGHDIRKGTLIQIDVLSVHYDQELWGPEPVNEFHPERHLQKRHPLAFLPFGAGPRTCIGMRFALMEVKLCLAQLISTYRILPSSFEDYKLNITEQLSMTPDSVCIKVEKRITSSSH